MAGNPYKDNKGHYTTKENDGGECPHTFGKSKQEMPKQEKETKQNNIVDDKPKLDHAMIFRKKYNGFIGEAKNEAIKRMLGQSEASKFISQEQFNLFHKTFGENPTMQKVEEWLNKQLEEQEYNGLNKEATIKINTPERQAQRKQWVDEEIKKQEHRKDKNGVLSPIQYGKIAYLSLGDAGTGKSSAGGKAFKNQYGAYEVDPDIFKTDYIPESKNDPNMIGVAHEESSALSDEVFKHAINEGANIFYPTTASKYDKLVKKIQTLKDKGYKVYVDYISLDTKENVIRTLTRAMGEGRYTGPDVIARSYGKSRDNFEQLLKEHPELVDGWRDVDNNNGPKVVDQGGKNIFGGK